MRPHPRAETDGARFTPNAPGPTRRERWSLQLRWLGLSAVVMLRAASTLLSVDSSPQIRRHPSVGLPPTGPTATDEQLEWLVATYGPTLYKVAYAITKEAAIAEDVVQDGLLQAWSSMPSWEGDVPIKWMRRVVRNRAISVMRKENRSAASEDWDGHTAMQPDVERVVESRQMVAAVERAMDVLDEASRLMLVLRETEDMSYDELADLLDLTNSAVKAKLYRARHALKAELKGWDL